MVQVNRDMRWLKPSDGQR